jgi:hypothetical protein
MLRGRLRLRLRLWLPKGGRGGRGRRAHTVLRMKERTVLQCQFLLLLLLLLLLQFQPSRSRGGRCPSNGELIRCVLRQVRRVATAAVVSIASAISLWRPHVCCLCFVPRAHCTALQCGGVRWPASWLKRFRGGQRHRGARDTRREEEESG